MFCTLYSLPAGTSFGLIMHILTFMVVIHTVSYLEKVTFRAENHFVIWARFDKRDKNYYVCIMLR